MFHGRQSWDVAGRAIAAPAFGLAAPRPPRWRDVDLVVDLGRDLFSPGWWRGAGTLAVLCGAALLFAPLIDPLPAAGRSSDEDALQSRALGITPLSAGSRTGLRMTATEAVEPLEFAPERPTIEFSVWLGPGDSIARMLVRAGANVGDASQAGAMIARAGGHLEPGTVVAVRLGRKTGRSRPLERIILKAGIDLKLAVERVGGALTLTRQAIAVDSTPLRIRGRAGDGLYWSLRAAGASPETAAEYLRALAREIDVGDISAYDRFDLVLANRRAATGESRTGDLLYAGIARIGGRSLQLVRWPVGGRMQWIDAASLASAASESAGMMWPVAGPITSRFGYRIHPILRYTRFHSGIDFGATWGTPIAAAADGQVVRAGWAGGYGRQVRLAHADGLISSYSHMSRIVVAPGRSVQRGELIGYVGSSGLSTGPHLHYEVIQGGRKLNPLSVRLASAPAVDPAQLGAFKARLRELLSVGVRRR